MQLDTSLRRTWFRHLLPVVAVLLLFAPSSPPPDAADWIRYHSRYATILYHADDDRVAFTRSITPGLAFLNGNPRKTPTLTAAEVDRLTARVMKILDVRLADFHVLIYLYRRHAELEQSFPLALDSPPIALYDHRTRSIAISIDDASRGVLAHELAHAVICAAFPSPLPRGMQEILARYVDEHLGE